MVTDPEKKKYFRIQASHKATPGSEYSKDAVKRKRDEQEVCLSIHVIRDYPKCPEEKLMIRNTNAKYATKNKWPERKSSGLRFYITRLLAMSRRLEHSRARRVLCMNVRRCCMQASCVQKNCIGSSRGQPSIQSAK